MELKRKSTMEQPVRPSTSQGVAQSARKLERRPTVDLGKNRPASAMGGSKSMIQITEPIKAPGEKADVKQNP